MKGVTKPSQSLETKLNMIANRSRENLNAKFKFLMPLFTDRNLSCCFDELDGKKAVGTDGKTKQEYGACMFTIFETLKLWKINPHTWLLTYLYECAINTGLPPRKIERYLPWNMTKETIKIFSEPPKHQMPIESG